MYDTKVPEMLLIKLPGNSELSNTTFSPFHHEHAWA